MPVIVCNSDYADHEGTDLAFPLNEEPMINIAEVMTSDVFTLGPGDSLAQARSLMLEKHIRHIPVVNDEREVVGLLTHRDLLGVADSSLEEQETSQRQRRESGIALETVMTTELCSVDEHASLRGAALHLQQHKHGCLPVLRDGKLIGIITDSDFVTVAINLLEQLEQVDPSEEDF